MSGMRFPILMSRRRLARSRVRSEARKTPRCDFSSLKREARQSACGADVRELLGHENSHVVRFPVMRPNVRQ